MIVILPFYWGYDLEKEAIFTHIPIQLNPGKIENSKSFRLWKQGTDKKFRCILTVR